MSGSLEVCRQCRQDAAGLHLLPSPLTATTRVSSPHSCLPPSSSTPPKDAQSYLESKGAADRIDYIMVIYSVIHLPLPSSHGPAIPLPSTLYPHSSLRPHQPKSASELRAQKLTESELLVRLAARVDALEGNATLLADSGDGRGDGVGSSGDAYESRLAKLEKEVGMLIAHHNRHPASGEEQATRRLDQASTPVARKELLDVRAAAGPRLPPPGRLRGVRPAR